MNKPTLFALAALTTLTLSGCYGTYYGGAVYRSAPSYGGYDEDYYQEPTYVRHDYVFISGRQYYVPVYCHHDSVYYIYEGRRSYFSPAAGAKYRSHHEHHRVAQRQEHQNSDQRPQIARNENDRQKAAYRARLEQARKQQEYQRESHNREAVVRQNAQHADPRKKNDKKKKKDE